MMKAAAIDRFGPPSVLTIHNVPVPKPGARDVLIEMHAAGVGIWDAEQRRGAYETGREKFPIVLGTDGAGTVAATGSGVKDFVFGDNVWAYEFDNPKGGFYAEYVAVNVDHIGMVPRQLDLLHAGAGCVTSLTALQGIDDHLGLKQGETVLIFGATGGVGTLAVQFAKRRLARVIATASSAGGKRLVRELGADHVFDARADDVAVEIQRFAPDGLDAALALAGGETVEHCLRFVRAGGRIAYPNGVFPEPQPRPKVRFIPYDAVASPDHFANLTRAVAETRLRVPIAAVYPLEQAAQAHERIEQRGVIGRIVLQIRE
jgi:NADPH:quinone reductase-like Zn-dependent oxidoreductase